MHIYKHSLRWSLVTALAGLGLSHMALKDPCPRYNVHGVNCPELPDGESWDWTQISSIGNSENKFFPLCRYTQPFKTPSAEWSPGQTVDVEFHGSAAHSGGHSEFSVSYDNGATFAVIHQELKYMFFGTPTQVTNRPKKLKYSIKLPNDLPGADNAVFAWTWVNASGNREFYMNCVDVKIVGEPGEYTGKQMTVVNYGPDMPVIPEFLGNYSTGIEYYTNAPNITVYGDGNAVYNSEVADDSD